MNLPPADASSRADQAVAMIDLFGSIGATHFDITHTNLAEEKRGFRSNRPLAEVRESMPPLVAAADRRQNNLIVRPRVDGVTCIQLDDLDRPKARAAASAAFLVLETSPGNYQAWIAVRDAPLGTTSRLRKGAGADPNASGATRVAGSQNFKAKYAPHFPTIRIAAAKHGHLVSVADLEALNILAPEPEAVGIAAPVTGSRSNRQAARSWPNYQTCLDKAPAGPSGNPSRTSVDFVWCKIATSWGHSPEATAARLMQESTKAQENGADYALKTAQRAAWAAAQRSRPPRP